MRLDVSEQLNKKIQNHALFCDMPQKSLWSILDKCVLKLYKKSEQILYSKMNITSLYLVITGMAEVFVEGNSSKKSVLEVLVENDVIGLTSISQMINNVMTNDIQNKHENGLQISSGYKVDNSADNANQQVAVTIEAITDCYVLEIPKEVVKDVLAETSARKFLLKHLAMKYRDVYISFAEQVRLANDWGESEAFIRRVQDLMRQPVLTVTVNESIQTVAKLMAKHRITSVVVIDEERLLVGIITQQDLVQRVLAGGITQDIETDNTGQKAKVEDAGFTALMGILAKDIMTKNPHTITRNAYYYEALSMFYMKGVKHLPVVDEFGKAVGIITMSDLIAKKNHGTMEIIKTIEQASYRDLVKVKTAIYDVLSSLIKDDISATNTLEVITTFYDRLSSRCVQLAVEILAEQGFGMPPVDFAWYLMGSGGRGEQFMLTDQDHFLVYDDLEKTGNWNKQQLSYDDQSADMEELEIVHVEQYFTLLGKKIVELLEGVGYKRCKGLMMSSEANWRGSIYTWQERLRTWALKSTDDDILLGHNFLSFRYVAGSNAVNEKFVTMVKKQLKVSKTFLYLMAQQEREHLVPQLEQPMIAFFGQRQSVIDIKKHALFPFHRCLQILGVHYDIVEGTPLEILNELEKKGHIISSFAAELRHAFEVSLNTRIKLSWQKHLRGEESTSEIKLAEINSWEREELIIALKSIRALQSFLLKKL